MLVSQIVTNYCVSGVRCNVRTGYFLNLSCRLFEQQGLVLVWIWVGRLNIFLICEAGIIKDIGHEAHDPVVWSASAK